MKDIYDWTFDMSSFCFVMIADDAQVSCFLWHYFFFIYRNLLLRRRKFFNLKRHKPAHTKEKNVFLQNEMNLHIDNIHRHFHLSAQRRNFFLNSHCKINSQTHNFKTHYSSPIVGSAFTRLKIEKKKKSKQIHKGEKMTSYYGEYLHRLLV